MFLNQKLVEITTEQARLARAPLREAFLRYMGTLGVVAAVVLIMQHVSIQPSVGGILTMAVVMICAWLGGLGPSLCMPPLILVLSRWPEDKSWNLSGEEWIAFAVITTITTAVGLAGQYRHRIRVVTRQHEQRLGDQARALSLAHIVFCDVQSRVTEWNEGAERMFGWMSSEAVGRNLHELLQTQFPCDLEEIHAELLRSGQWKGEVIHHRKDGTELIIATHWILYRDERGAPIGIAKIHNDVSELRRAEEAVREADRRKDEFLAMLAHELRNPLAPIRMGLELMKLSQDDPQALEDIRGTMERQTQQLVTLVDDLLDVSRITRGKLQLRKCPVNLAAVMQSAVEASRPFIEEARHELHFALPDRRIHLDADPHRLAQVFSNLLNNAAKYTAPGGRIAFQAEQQGHSVVISVKDDGIGIPSDMAERIFELFAQAESPPGQGNSGLGIGLTLVKSLVEMHGGRVDVHSEGPLKGSEFMVHLPILVKSPDHVPTPISPSTQPADGQGRKVLIVDDNRAAVKMLSLVIQSLGNEVRTACDGKEAIEVAADFRPELVLMDLGMPKMNGYEAARHIRQQSWGRDMLLVALSGWGQEDDKRRTKEAGFDHHLTKPAEPAELQRLLSQNERKVS